MCYGSGSCALATWCWSPLPVLGLAWHELEVSRSPGRHATVGTYWLARGWLSACSAPHLKLNFLLEVPSLSWTMGNALLWIFSVVSEHINFDPPEQLSVWRKLRALCRERRVLESRLQCLTCKENFAEGPSYWTLTVLRLFFFFFFCKWTFFVLLIFYFCLGSTVTPWYGALIIAFSGPAICPVDLQHTNTALSLIRLSTAFLFPHSLSLKKREIPLNTTLSVSASLPWKREAIVKKRREISGVKVPEA